MTAELITQLVAAGTPAHLVAQVAMLAARADLADQRVAEALAADRRSPAAIKQQRYRDRLKEGVTNGNDVTQTVTRYGEGNGEPAPAPSPLPSPQTPQLTPRPHPHPGVFDAYARGLTATAMLEVLIAGCRYVAGQGGKPKRPQSRPWPKDMPPPANVAAEQWAGFIAHRIARRQPLTPRAYDLLVKALAAHSTDEWPPGAIVDEMVQRGWLSFKPEWLTRKPEPRNGQQSDQPRSHQRQRGGWSPRPGMEGAEPAFLAD